MLIDGVSYNVEFAKNSEKAAWITLHIEVCKNMSEAEANKYLSSVYDKIVGKTGKPATAES